MKKIIIFTLVLLIVSSCAASFAKLAPRTCPNVQAGWVSVTIGESGAEIIEVVYPCPFADLPVLGVSPAQGQGSFWVDTFQANSLTGAVGSIALLGTPGQVVTFSWLATLPTP